MNNLCLSRSVPVTTSIDAVKQECLFVCYNNYCLCYFYFVNSYLELFCYVYACITALVLFRYRPTLSVDFISSQLCFESVDQCVEFLSGCGAVLVDQGRTIDCKQSLGRLT